MVPAHLKLLPTNFARKQLQACLNEGLRIKGSEFPYSDARDALVEIEKNLQSIDGSFEKAALSLKTRSGKSDAGVRDGIRNLGTQTITRIDDFLPLLGFILRSTNARNAFE